MAQTLASSRLVLVFLVFLLPVVLALTAFYGPRALAATVSQCEHKGAKLVEVVLDDAQFNSSAGLKRGSPVSISILDASTQRCAATLEPDLILPSFPLLSFPLLSSTFI